MAAVPKSRRSHRKIRTRRAHWRAHMAQAGECPHCHELRLAHRVCPHCGYYKGKQAVEIKSKEE
ncbi:MAG: 50S ribosomal protein L32 [Candidatus Bipolaricaulota bacterium]